MALTTEPKKIICDTCSKTSTLPGAYGQWIVACIATFENRRGLEGYGVNHYCSVTCLRGAGIDIRAPQ